MTQENVILGGARTATAGHVGTPGFGRFAAGSWPVMLERGQGIAIPLENPNAKS